MPVASPGASLVTFALLIFGQGMISELEGVARPSAMAGIGAPGIPIGALAAIVPLGALPGSTR